MGLVLQTQRRAIEELKKEVKTSWPESFFEKNVNCFLDQDRKRIFCLGVSEGIGTCSDIHGMNVAVFIENFTDEKKLDKQKVKKCAYAVLLSNPVEINGYYLRFLDLLEPTFIDEDSSILFFRRTGFVSSYIPI